MNRFLNRTMASSLAVLMAFAVFAPAAADTTASGGELFSITVDGEHVAGTAPPKATDKVTGKAGGSDLPEADIQVKYDGLGANPILNVATADLRRSFAAGEQVPFLASNNYPGYIARQEIRIFATGRNAPVDPVAVIPVAADGRASWTMPAGEGSGPDDGFVYVLRAYDAKGRFDETKPLTLARQTGVLPGDEPQHAVAPGVGDDNTAFRNIQVDGGAVTVYGRNIPGDVHVTVLGDRIPVDAEGAFVVQRILPPGDHEVDITLKGADGGSVAFDRDINIPSSEWFYVGLADLTVGQRSGSKHIEAVTPGEFDGVYTKGRAAFYLKGKIKGRWLLTAAGDTGSSSVENMFKGLDDKDPRAFLGRIDPDDYYPVYGDDSTSIEDAPTRGKFYVRLERGDSHVLWGNFKTDIRGTEFLRNDRALYGGSLVLKTDRMVPSGERAGELYAYAAQPGTLPQRDILRGTGGSAYFLSHQDITVGSETLYIEVRDPITDLVIERRQLRYGQDYTIDYLQGVVLLQEPLSATVRDGRAVQAGANGGNYQYLIAAYEFTPAAGDVDGYVYGGRAQQWLGNHVRLGTTGAVEKTGSADQTLAGADIQLYKSERTFLEAEVATSKGPGFGFSQSIDGGLTITDPEVDTDNKRAMAYRVLGRMDLSDVVPGLKGNLQGNYAYKQKGFSTLDEEVTENQHQWGVKGDLALSDRVTLDFYHDQQNLEDGTYDQKTGAGLALKLSSRDTLTAGLERAAVNDEDDGTDGERTDAALKLERVLDEDTSVYGFGQATMQRSGNIDRNDRAGIGGTRALTDKLDATAEVSYGTGGVGGRVLLEYEPAAAERYYIGYTMNPAETYQNDFFSTMEEDDIGAIVAGVKRSYSERLSVYAEDKYDFLGFQQSFTQAYGVTYTPVPEWKFGGAIESGMVWDDSPQGVVETGDGGFHRTAVSLSAAYAPNDKMSASLKGETRWDDPDNGESDTVGYYVAGRFSTAVNEDWRFIASLDAVITDQTDTTLEGRFIEASAGYAYRPVSNDRLNALIRYTFLYDLPGPDQVTYDGNAEGTSQRSHIFDADISYDLIPMLTLGGKYGVRFGDMKLDDGEGWENSTAQLAVLRADFHVIKQWDLLIEGRSLWETESESAEFGLVAAIYRQMGENFEVGVGYNFGQYSDDLADLTADDHGFFVNAVGKF